MLLDNYPILCLNVHFLRIMVYLVEYKETLLNVRALRNYFICINSLEILATKMNKTNINRYLHQNVSYAFYNYLLQYMHFLSEIYYDAFTHLMPSHSNISWPNTFSTICLNL